MHARLFLAACASAALLSAGACNNTPNNNTDQTKAAHDTAAATKGTSGTDDQQKPITRTGCLQKGDGSDFILTQINEPPAGEPVAQQDLKEAEHAYRLNAKHTNDDDWSKMVGRQVRVSGTLAKRGDVDQKVGTSGSNDNPPKIHESDLAQIDVSDIQQLAASCGNHAGKRGANSTAKPRRK